MVDTGLEASQDVARGTRKECLPASGSKSLQNDCNLLSQCRGKERKGDCNMEKARAFPKSGGVEQQPALEDSSSVWPEHGGR